MSQIILKNMPKYKFTLENFEGPLDLLLHLIAKNKMNIFDISLSKLTDEYIEYINELSEKNIEIASEFIVMASTLLDIKARKLLPKLEEENGEEEEVTEEDIINRIIEYKKYKEVSNEILNMYSKNFGSFSKSMEKIKFNKRVEYTGEKFNKSQIHDIYMDVINRNTRKINNKSDEIKKIAIYEKVTVKDKVTQIVNYLNSNTQMVFNEVFSLETCNNVEVVTAFLGALELSKLKQVELEQNYLFSDINITKTHDNIELDLSIFKE